MERSITAGSIKHLSQRRYRMKKFTLTHIFGIIGALSWSGTVWLRETTLSNINFLNFVLGIMPNISASWFFIWIGEQVITKTNRNFTFKTASLVSAAVLLLALISEVIHDVFLNSPFDINDITATVAAIILYLTVFYLSKHKTDR